MSLHWIPSAPNPQPRPLEIVELHVRNIEKLGPDFYMSCSCGFFSTSCLTADEAHARPCEVEQILAESDYRERQILARVRAGH